MEKDPNATLPFSVNWSKWLAKEEDTIASVVWTVPTGLVKETSPAPTVVDGRATVWLSGGTPRREYTVTCKITTTGGRTDERSIPITVKNR